MLSPSPMRAFQPRENGRGASAGDIAPAGAVQLLQDLHRRKRAVAPARGPEPEGLQEGWREAAQGHVLRRRAHKRVRIGRSRERFRPAAGPPEGAPTRPPGRPPPRRRPPSSFATDRASRVASNRRIRRPTSRAEDTLCRFWAARAAANSSPTCLSNICTAASDSRASRSITCAASVARRRRTE